MKIFHLTGSSNQENQEPNTRQDSFFGFLQATFVSVAIKNSKVSHLPQKVSQINIKSEMITIIWNCML